MSHADSAENEKSKIPSAFKIGLIGGTLIFLATGGWLLFAPSLWVDAGGNSPYDLILQGKIQSSDRPYNVSLVKPVVSGQGGSWHPSNETISNKWIEVSGCGRTYSANETVLVMVTIQNHHIIEPNTHDIIQAVDPPQFVDSSYHSISQCKFP